MIIYLIASFPVMRFYARKGIEKLHPVKSPLRNIAYEMLFEQLQKAIMKSDHQDI